LVGLSSTEIGNGSLGRWGHQLIEKRQSFLCMNLEDIVAKLYLLPKPSKEALKVLANDYF